MWIVWIEKKILKTLGILLGVIIIVLTAFHFWFINNAESILADLVESKSKNKLKLSVKNLKFNYFSRNIEMDNVVFYSNDSLDQNTTYRFKVDHIKLKVKKILPIFLEKKIQIDSLFLDAPDVEVVRLKPVERSIKKDIKDVSIPEEMGKIYNSIMDALQMLEVTRFEFNEGRFTLINRITPGQQPLIISNLHFHIDNLRFDTVQQKDKFLFSDQMVFSTSNQDILFPDGNHRLAFSNFRINIKNQLIEIDSCFLSGKKEDSRSGFSIFFDTLKMANFDFNALYQEELLKADSVYCLNSVFKIILDPEVDTGARKQLPNLDSIIQQLTGDLQLGYVGVINSSIDITTFRNGKPNTFTSDNNNFEMVGLSIDHSRAKPVLLEGFTMAIRNYENFLKDSSYFVRFDSIILRDNKILLSKFSVNTRPGIDTKNIQVNLFELSDLAWPVLLFNKTIKAREATLYYPVIDYTQPPNAKKKNKQNIFQALVGISDLMDLDRLRIVNGNIRLRLGNQTELQMENASMVVNSERLVESKEISGIEQSVEEVQFSKAVFKIKDLYAELRDAQFTGDSNQLSVRQVRVYNRGQTINSLAKNVLLNELRFDEASNSIYANKVIWQQANIEINLPNKKGKNNSSAAIHLKNVNGRNTSLEINNEKNSFSAFLSSITAAEITQKDKLETTGLEMRGNNFISVNKTSELKIANFAIADQKNSLLKSVHFRQYKDNDSIELTIPELNITPDINRMANGSMHAEHIRMANPEIVIKTKQKDTMQGKEQKSLPDVDIGRIEIVSPDISVENSSTKGLFNFKWNGKGNSISLRNVKTEGGKENGIRIGSLNGNFSNLSLADENGKTFRSNEGVIEAQLQNIVLRSGDSLYWAAGITEVNAKNFSADSIGKKSGTLRLDAGKLRNLSLNSEIINDLPALIEKNPKFSLSHLTGFVINEKSDFRWHNLSFSNTNQSASLDSFSYKPVISRDSFVAASPYQVDYMTLETGRIDITKINVLRYLKDSIMRVEDIVINNANFTSYRDKRPPFRSGIIKPLPVSILKNVPFLFSIDTVKIMNGKVVYTELNEKTNETGVIPVTRLNGDILNIMNNNFTDKDSLRIRLNGYLLDSAWIRLRTRESYTDTLGTFLITVRMRPGTLTYLNSVLMPLASVRIQTGQLDTLNMRAVGTEHLAFGEIRMFYHDLKVKFLRDGKEAKKGFLTGLMTFIANSFIIKKENKKKIAVVYFPRLRDRSFINYYIKIAMSGAASSVGAKSNRKLLRKYEKQLERYQLPPIDFD